MTELVIDHPSPASATSSSTSPDGSNGTDITSISINGSDSVHPHVKTESTTSEGSNFAAPKSDKPRPHVCTICSRSFARLEHLKRHERSHTKEKPFECPECTRCFARRDLLLRHQQKLHQTSIPSARAKPVRRESTSGVSTTSARVRKNSVANSSTASVGSVTGASRGRANTFSHLDLAAVGLLGARKQDSPNSDQSTTPLPGQSNSTDLFKTPQHPGLQRRMTTDGRGHSRSNTLSHIPHLGLENTWRQSLPTVPSGTAINQMLDFSDTPAGAPTINPLQLHLDDPLDSIDSPFMENFEFMGGFNSNVLNGLSDQGVSGTSLSGMSNHSPMFADQTDNTYNQGGLYPQSFNMWQQQPQSLLTPDTALMTPDIATHLQTDYGLPVDMRLNPTPQNHVDGYYPTPPPFSSLSPDLADNTLFPNFAQSMSLPTNQTAQAFASPNASMFDSSQFQQRSLAVTSITELTRQALLQSLAQSTSYGQRRFSTSLTPATSSSRRDSSTPAAPALPSVEDIQRYVEAYIVFFHPHLPFLHIPTLSFDNPAYTNSLRVANGHASGQGGIIGGGGCLILAMAAIGALIELDAAASKELFDAARKMIQLYLEERRNFDLAAAINSSRHNNDTSAQNTPLWLVQAMLLNVIYGHQCGDKVSGDCASTHCAALVSLGRAAGLLSTTQEPNVQMSNGHLLNPLSSPELERVRTHDSIAFSDPWGFATTIEDETAWRTWVAAEERKRTLYAIFNMSSLLVSAFNHAPAIMNSEIHLDLPCEEELWTAESAGIWTARNGPTSNHMSITFASALSRLLMAGQNQTMPQQNNGLSGSGMLMTDLGPSDLKPSTFGCLILINALHNFIWETRQRHAGVRWTTQESEGMIAHMEAALRAWQQSWAANPTHSPERPNPFQMGPLSADSIPLLDLAYVRLFVNLGLSKEHAWARDFEEMAEELRSGMDIIQHADYSRSESDQSSETEESRKTAIIPGPEGYDIKIALSAHEQSEQKKTSRRERQLRKAAFYAADSLLFSSKLGVTFMDLSPRDLPVQSAMCTFDCAQVLAEWITTVQERIGSYVGVIGRDTVDFSQQLPAHMMLEDEDCKLLEKTRDILASAEAKMTTELSGLKDAGAAMAIMSALPSYSQRGYGAQILGVTAFTLRRAATWPVLTLMAHGLDIQAGHMQKRVDQSVAMAGRM